MRQDQLEGRGKVSYETIHEWAIDVPISAKAYKLWQILRFHWMRGLRSSMPSHDELAARLHLSAPGGARSVARYLNELQGQGMFGRDKDEEGRTQTRDKGGHFGGCTFWVWVGEDRPLTPAEKESLELQEDLPGLGDDPGAGPEAVTPPGGMNSAVPGAASAEQNSAGPDSLRSVPVGGISETAKPRDHRETPVSIGGETALSVGGETPVSTGSNKEDNSSGALGREPPLSPGLGAGGGVLGAGEQNSAGTTKPPAPTTRVVRPPRFQTDDDRGQGDADWAVLIETDPARATDQGYPAGRREFDQIIAYGGVGFTVILEGAKLFRKAKDATGKTGTDHIPKIGTWLRDRGWADDIRVPGQNSAGTAKPQGGRDARAPTPISEQMKRGKQIFGGDA